MKKKKNPTGRRVDIMWLLLTKWKAKESLYVFCTWGWFLATLLIFVYLMECIVTRWVGGGAAAAALACGWGGRYRSKVMTWGPPTVEFASLQLPSLVVRLRNGGNSISCLTSDSRNQMVFTWGEPMGEVATRRWGSWRQLDATPKLHPHEINHTETHNDTLKTGNQ